MIRCDVRVFTNETRPCPNETRPRSNKAGTRPNETGTFNGKYLKSANDESTDHRHR